MTWCLVLIICALSLTAMALVLYVLDEKERK